MDLQKKIEVARISTIRLLIAMTSIHNLIIHQMDVKTTFLNGDLDEEQAPKQWHQNFDEVVLSNCYLLNQADKCVYSKFDELVKGVIICYVVDGHVFFGVMAALMYAMTCTRPNIAFVVGKTEQCWKVTLMQARLQHKDNSYTMWLGILPLFLVGGVISWASKKQTCITSSTMKSEFVALAAVGKEAGWLKNLLLEILLWSKPIAPISIRCDSVATLAKAYSQMYNGKSSS
ncbi:zinc finger, CCHC-type containing protein [Tanacetum coccineum]